MLEIDVIATYIDRICSIICAIGTIIAIIDNRNNRL